MLFLATVTLELAQTMKFDPVPMILSEIFCANLGGSATMCGDPPNIIIGTSLGYTFSDFITNTGAVAAIFFVLMLAYFTLCFRKELKSAERENGGAAACPAPSTAVTNKAAFFASAGVFLLAVVLLITHAQTELSAFVDNIPFAATMIPVIRAIAAAEGMDIGVLAWALSLGTDLGGNATPIGASANVVGTSVSAKCGYPISWGRYCKYCVPATALVMLVSTAYLFLRYL